MTLSRKWEKRRVLLSKFDYERSYSPEELVRKEVEARKIQTQALSKMEAEIRNRKEAAMMAI